MADYTTLYTNLGNIKKILDEHGVETNASDDDVIAQFIASVSVDLETATNRAFVSASATRFFDVPEDGRTLYVDDFTSLTSITNGDGTSIATSDVLLLPANITPKYAIRIKASSTAVFAPVTASGETIQAIAVVALWGVSAACPADVRTGIEEMVMVKYQARRGIVTEGLILDREQAQKNWDKLVAKYGKVL